MKQPLKVLFLLEDLCFGGTQKQNVALAKRLDRAKFSPEILTLGGPADLDEEAAPVPLHHLGSKPHPDPLFFVRLFPKLRELKPDILVPCTALPNIWGRIWGKFLKIPVIVGTCRGGGAPMRQHERLLWRLADGMICNSRILREKLLKIGVPDDRLAYIDNGIDCQHFHMGAQNERRPDLVLCVARLAPDKDHQTLIRAFASVAREFPEARLRIVGEGPSENALGELIASLPPEIARRVEMTGASADPASHYREAGVFAMSSIREGQPNVILEAMASGLPVCATNVGGIPDLIHDNGFLSAPGDTEALAKNLRLLLLNPENSAAMGARGRKRVEKDFSFDVMTSRHEDFFLKLWENCQKRLPCNKN